MNTQQDAHARPFNEALRLSFALFRRTIGAKYRKSFLGYLWILIPALLITAGVWLANRSGVIDAGVTKLPYPLFVLLGVLIWQVFAEAIEVPYKSLEGARSYLTRVQFPREAIVLVGIYEGLINAAVRFLFVVSLAIIFYQPSMFGLVGLLVCFLLAFFLAAGIGLFLAPFLILFSDLQNTMRLILTYGIFLTPAFYSPSGGLFGDLVNLNPVAPMMAGARHALSDGFLPEPLTIAVIAGIAVLLCVVGTIFFRQSVPHLVERMLLGGR